jgi:alkylation response protein AidB-like acyl-CoA dehydrogenase
MQDSTILELTEEYLRSHVASKANAIDENTEALRSALQGLADRHLLALRTSKNPGITPLTFCAFQELIARFSGALAFLQTQHQSAASMLAKSENEALKQTYLPLMGNGQKLVGIGFSHLRRADNPPLKAIPVEGGYRLHGHIPWITGFEFFQTVLIAALLPTGEAVYGMVPFTNVQHDGEIRLSQPMSLAAMTSTNTVTAELTEWFLPTSHVAFILPAGEIHRSDLANVLNHSFFALGCAQAGLDIVELMRQQKPFLAIAAAQNALIQELAECRRSIYATYSQETSFDVKLKLRAWSIELAVRCAHAAVIISSGAANSTFHPAQRVYREALVFSVAGQTNAVLEATLEQLRRSKMRDEG